MTFGGAFFFTCTYTYNLNGIFGVNVLQGLCILFNNAMNHVSLFLLERVLSDAMAHQFFQLFHTQLSILS
jgi:hypothetical protein